MAFGRRNHKVYLILAAILIVPVIAGYTVIECLARFDFNNDGALSNWGKMVLKGQVDYKLMKQGDNGFVEAISDKTCSALYYRLTFKLKEHPILSWRWRVSKFPDKSEALTEKQKDDYAARVYVIFPFLCFSSSKFIEYIWDEDIPVGTVLTSPEGGNIRLIVARNGRRDEGQWVEESRNVYEDYIVAFGNEPKMSVGAIAIMCDADSTKSRAEAMFDDIVVGGRAHLKTEGGNND